MGGPYDVRAKVVQAIVSELNHKPFCKMGPLSHIITVRAYHRRVSQESHHGFSQSELATESVEFSAAITCRRTSRATADGDADDHSECRKHCLCRLIITTCALPM